MVDIIHGTLTVVRREPPSETALENTYVGYDLKA